MSRRNNYLVHYKKRKRDEEIQRGDKAKAKTN